MEKKVSKLTGLLALVVFALFALCVLGVLLTGAKGYEALVRRGGENYAVRTAAQYLSTRVRQGDCAGGIAVEDFGSQSALVLRQEIDGEPYLTRVYCYDGFLRELFTTETGSFSPEDGEKLLEMESLRFAAEGDSLSAQFVTAGKPGNCIWYLRSGEVQP